MKKLLGILGGILAVGGLTYTIAEMVYWREFDTHFKKRKSAPAPKSDQNWDVALDEFLHTYNKYQGYLRNDDYLTYSETLEEDKKNAQLAYTNARTKIMNQLNKE